MLCEERDGVARCVVEAIDADEDGHGAAQCEAAPGDDCDDDNAQITRTQMRRVTGSTTIATSASISTMG
jgi:hypothetical protein